VRAGIESRTGVSAGAPGEGTLPRAALVRGVAFFSTDEPDDCGAAALAAALSKAGVHRDAGRVRAAIYDPARGGAPTSAMLRYAREQGLFAVARGGPLEETWVLDDLKAWICAGVPPVALISAAPVAPGRFHYVLLTGYDDDARALLFQDQGNREAAISYDAFFPLWCEARGWALIACAPSIRLPPGEGGLTAREVGALGWLAEKAGDLESARRHYRAALAKDPAFAEARHNLANVERALGARPARPGVHIGSRGLEEQP
jgi:hypothetical protein